MNSFITDESLEHRLRYTISTAWQAFGRKVGGGTISVNKEASMQLQYAYILKQLLPMALHRPDEFADVELETGVTTKSGNSNVDLLLKARSSSGSFSIAIEMKCYRNITSSGGTRGAHDIFMKDVYEDLHVLEEYIEAGVACRGVSLVICDLERIVNPTRKVGKCWAYDISEGAIFSGGEITVNTGGKPVRVILSKSYKFHWNKFSDFWFAEIEGTL